MAENIIIFSGKQYSGKDTLAKILLSKMTDYKRCAMGDIIKLEYARQKGLTYDEIEKNKSIYRQDLINLGNWGRAQSDDYWLKKIIEQNGNIMVTDVRVPFEYKTFKDAGAISIRVECQREIRATRGELVGETDVTEVGLDHINDWDYVVHNDSSYEELEKQAMKLVEVLTKC